MCFQSTVGVEWTGKACHSVAVYVRECDMGEVWEVTTAYPSRKEHHCRCTVEGPQPVRGGTLGLFFLEPSHTHFLMVMVRTSFSSGGA